MNPSMSRSELERLVSDAEADGALRRALRHCRSGQELVLAARRLGYGVTRVDLRQARQEERQQGRRLRKSSDALEAGVASVSDAAPPAQSGG